MDGIYALIDPSSAITALNMNDEFNLFGRKAYLIGHTFEAFPPIEDTPVQKAFAAAAPVVEEEGSLLDNFAVGVLATAALAGLAYVAFGAATVLTGGAALVLVGACLAGAAVATATVTVAATVQDVRSGHTRTAKEFAGQLGAAAVQGAVTGATLYGLQVAIPGASMLLGMDLAGAFGSSSITSVVHFSKAATVAGCFLMTGQALRGGGEIARIGTGYNWVLENMFGGDADVYNGTVAMMDALTVYTILVGWMNLPEEERVSQEKLIEKATKDLKEGTSKTYISPEMETKILEGQRKTPTKNEVIGGHSPNINNTNPKYATEVLEVYSDGTKKIGFYIQFDDGNLSTYKKSTIFPDSWSDKKIIDSISTVGDTNPIGFRGRDGATLHRGMIDGVQVEVIKIGNDVTSGYPTGGGLTGILSGFDLVN